MALVIKEDNFDELVLKADKPVLLDFWAEWCMPCKMIGPIIEELADEYKDKAVIGKISVDDEPGLANKYGVTSIPTLVVFHKGEIVSQKVGASNRETIEEMFKELV